MMLMIENQESGREVINQMGPRRNSNASQFPSQLSDPSHFAPQFFSTPNEDIPGKQGAECRVQGAGAQPGGGALPDLVNKSRDNYILLCLHVTG